MKAVISNKIYLIVSQEYYKALKKELTYKIPSYINPDNPIIISNIKVINADIQGGNMLVSIPVGRFDLIPLGYEIVDNRIFNPVDMPEFQFNLRPGQQEIYDQVDDNCIINAPPGWGKTFTGLAIAGKLGQKTLIVTHTVDLRNQWENEIVKTLGIRPGKIGSSQFNIEPPIVVSNTQTLVKKIKEVNRTFGTLIMDEMHHAPSPTFSKIIDYSFARYKIGLSATIERKDGKHVVFRDYFGSNVLKASKENVMDPSILVVKSGLTMPQEGAWVHRLNALMSSDVYIDLIVKIADKMVDKGHKVLVVADRVEFLKQCAARSTKKAVYSIGDGADREKIHKGVFDGSVEIIFGSQSIYSEGISVAPLSCLIPASPINNDPLLEQLIGRVERLYEGKLDPVVVDIKLDGYTAQNQFNNRFGFYLKQGYDINYF